MKPPYFVEDPAGDDPRPLKQVDYRFCVGVPGGPRSGVYRIWVKTKGDVYFGSREIASTFKVSLHASGVCLAGYTKQYVDKLRAAGRWAGGPRHHERWERQLRPRMPTPAAQVLFPTAELRTMELRVRKPVRWILPAADEWDLTRVSFAFSERSNPDRYRWTSPDDGGPWPFLRVDLADEVLWVAVQRETISEPLLSEESIAWLRRGFDVGPRVGPRLDVFGDGKMLDLAWDTDRFG